MSAQNRSRMLAILAVQILVLGASQASGDQSDNLYRENLFLGLSQSSDEERERRYQENLRQRLARVSAKKVQMKQHADLHTIMMIVEECIRYGYDKHSLRNRIDAEIHKIHASKDYVEAEERMPLLMAESAFTNFKEKIAESHQMVCGQMDGIPVR